MRLHQAAGRRFGWDANYATLGPLGLSAHQFGDAFVADTTEAADLLTLTVPIGTGRGDCDYGGQMIGHVPGREAALVRGGTHVTMHMAQGYAAVTVHIPEAALRDAVHALDGVEHVRFVPRVVLDTDSGRALLRTLFGACAAADNDPEDAAASSMAETFLFDLLVTQTHEPAKGSARTANLRAVRRGLDYLHAHAGEPLRMADVAAAAGTSVRMLQNGFSAHRGQSATQVLRSMRLTNARRRLLEDPLATITQVALASGFQHLGRFSVAYRATFGESPSATAKRSRAARL